MKSSAAFAFVLLLPLVGITHASEPVKPLVVVIEPGPSGEPHFMVGSTRQRNLYESLMTMLTERGRHAAVVYVSHEKVRLSDLLDAKGVAQAVGFSDVRFFLFSESRELMVGLSIAGPTVPFSTDPEQLMEAMPTKH